MRKYKTVMAVGMVVMPNVIEFRTKNEQMSMNTYIDLFIEMFQTFIAQSSPSSQMG